MPVDSNNGFPILIFDDLYGPVSIEFRIFLGKAVDGGARAGSTLFLAPAGRPCFRFFRVEERTKEVIKPVTEVRERIEEVPQVLTLEKLNQGDPTMMKRRMSK